MCFIELTGPLHVVCHEQVKITIVVIIQEAATGTPFLLLTSDSHFCSDIDKFSPVVPKQVIGPYRREENVNVSVIVIVPDGNSLAIKGHIQSHFFGDIREPTVAIVPEQRLRWLGASRSVVPWPATRIHEQQILIPVVIVVEKRTSPPHRFGEQFFARGTTVMLKPDSRRSRDVLKGHFRNFQRGGFSRFG